MSELETLADARAAIEDARKTIAAETLLGENFRSTADEAMRRILAGLDDATIPVPTAIALTGSLMNVVLNQIRHVDFQSHRGQPNLAIHA